jgi:hypothetical protein
VDVRPAARRLLIAILAVVVPAVSATPALARSKSFRTPSRNIYCLYMSTQGPGPWIRCDVRSLNDVAFRVDRTHKGRKIRITDSVFSPRAKVLRYGRSLNVGPFTCTSRTSGLTCRSRVSGHGFKISRQRQKRF